MVRDYFFSHAHRDLYYCRVVGFELICNDAEQTKLHSSSVHNFGAKQKLATSNTGFDAVAVSHDSMIAVTLNIGRTNLYITYYLFP